MSTYSAGLLLITAFGLIGIACVLIAISAVLNFRRRLPGMIRAIQEAYIVAQAPPAERKVQAAQDWAYIKRRFRERFLRRSG